MNNKIWGLTSVILGSFMVGSGITILSIDFWLKNNKHWRVVKVRNSSEK
jgi:hypothetical protein